MARILVRNDLQIVLRLAAVGHGPQQGIGILRLDILIDGDDPFTREAMQGAGAVERAPDLRFRGAARELDRDYRIEASERLVHREAHDAFDAEHRVQVMEIDWLHRHAADHARFARRHLTDKRGEDRVASARDRRHLHEGIVFLQVHIAVRFPERRFRLQELGVDETFDYDLRLRRHQKIDGLGAHEVDRRADQGARHRDLIEALRHLLHRRIGDSGWAADHNRTRERLAARLAFLPVGENAGTQLDGRIHAEAPRRLDLSAVIADVLDPGLRVLGDVVAGGKIRSIVPTRRRDRHG